MKKIAKWRLEAIEEIRSSMKTRSMRAFMRGMVDAMSEYDKELLWRFNGIYHYHVRCIYGNWRTMRYGKPGERNGKRTESEYEKLEIELMSRTLASTIPINISRVILGSWIDKARERQEKFIKWHDAECLERIEFLIDGVKK